MFQQLYLENVSWGQFQSFIYTLTLQTSDKHSAGVDSSKQLYKALKVKVIDVHNAVDGHKNFRLNLHRPKCNSDMAVLELKMVRKADQKKKVYMYPHHKIQHQLYAVEHIQSDAFSNEVL